MKALNGKWKFGNMESIPTEGALLPLPYGKEGGKMKQY
jgi:hypothetical protein